MLVPSGTETVTACLPPGGYPASSSVTPGPCCAVLCRPRRADGRDFGRREPRRSPAPVTAPRATPTSPPASLGASRQWSVVARGPSLPLLVRPSPAVRVGVGHREGVAVLRAGGHDWTCLRRAVAPAGATRAPNLVPAWPPKPVRACPANSVPSGLVKWFFVNACILRRSAQSASWTS